MALSRQSRIIESLAPAAGDEVVAKHFFSGMKDTRLACVLEAAAAREVHLAGVCTSICVMATALDLVEAAYAVTVHADAVADFDPEMHRFALLWLRRVLKVDVTPE